MDDAMDAIRATFFEECAELMESLEAGLLSIQAGAVDEDTVDAVFRAVHSIKGGAGAFALDPLVDYAHAFETALDAIRSGRLVPDGPVLDVLLRAADRLGDLIGESRDGSPVRVDPADLLALLGTTPADVDADTEQAVGGLYARPSSKNAGASGHDGDDGPRRWKIAFEPLPELLTSGNEPLFMFRALEVMGAIEVLAIEDDLPTLREMDVQLPRLRWEILLTPSAPDLTETEIEGVFEFAVDLCVLSIAPNHGPAIPNRSIADIASLNDRAVDDAIPAASSSAAMPLSRPVPFSPDEHLLRDDRSAAPSPQASTTIRVDLLRVDRLVNLVGELVISQSMLAQGMSRAGLDQHSDAVARLDELQQLTRDLQDSVMAIRAQPVKSLFQRMTRIVREAAQTTGKEVVLVTEGEATEVDKTVVERLAEPLTHMIRNAVDHGLELPHARVAAGKARTGTVRLRARQQADRVVIEIADDGAGIDRRRVLDRAIERGIVAPGTHLDDDEIDKLLFVPGFSTATEISSISGRGVGMDVVQRAIRDLDGTVVIGSVPGEGCSIMVTLPLTLAILDGMIVRSNRQRMVIPLSAILETQTQAAARIETLGAGKRLAWFQDRFVPLVDLAGGMGFDGPAVADGDDAALLFVQTDEAGPFALGADAIETQRQVVIKGLNDSFGRVPCVSAATILGDGQIALIVDPAGIAERLGLHRSGPPAKLLEEHA